MESHKPGWAGKPRFHAVLPPYFQVWGRFSPQVRALLCSPVATPQCPHTISSQLSTWLLLRCLTPFPGAAGRAEAGLPHAGRPVFLACHCTRLDVAWPADRQANYQSAAPWRQGARRPWLVIEPRGGGRGQGQLYSLNPQQKRLFKYPALGNNILPSASLWVTWRCPDPAPQSGPPPLEEMPTVTVTKLLRCLRLGTLHELLPQVPERRHGPHLLDGETGRATCPRPGSECMGSTTRQSALQLTPDALLSWGPPHRRPHLPLGHREPQGRCRGSRECGPVGWRLQRTHLYFREPLSTRISTR